MCRSGTEGGEAKTDSEPEESLDDDEEHDSTDGTKSSNTQQATKPSSDLPGACGRTGALRVAVDVGGSLTSTLACFPFVAGDGAIAGLFAPTLILNTPALGAVTVDAVFDMIVPKGARGFGGTLAPATSQALGADFT
jgi:hypothetical protein